MALPRFRASISSIILMFLLMPTFVSAQAHLARAGKTDYVIVVSKDASPSEKRGAGDLRRYLNQITGGDFQLADEDRPAGPHEIVVGASNRTLGVVDGALGDEEFVLKTVGEKIYIVGGRLRGTMYGCNEFLEKLGVRWYTPKVTQVSIRRTLELPQLNERQKPAFEYREPFFAEAFEPEWAARLRNNGHAPALDESYGGHFRYYPFAHSLDDLVPKSLFEQHPEYFPLIKGKRTEGYVQRCLSNPEVLRVTLETARKWAKEHPEAKIISITQNDCYRFCECENCTAIARKYGGMQSGLYIWFVNQVAEVFEKEFPDKLIDTFAYQFTEEPPTGIAPRKNVRVRLCPIAVCESHPYEECASAPSKKFIDNLQRWSKLTDTLYIWHYNTNFRHYLLPMPLFKQLPESVRLYQRSGVKGIFMQGAYAPGGGGQDSELKAYLLGKLLWNPKVSADAIATEWMQGVYHQGWRPMRAWFDLLQEKVADPKQHVFCFGQPKGAYLAADVLEQGDKLFDEAEKLVEGDEPALRDIQKARLWLRYAELIQKPTAGPELDSFVADVKKHGVQFMAEQVSVGEWEKKYREKLTTPQK